MLLLAAASCAGVRDPSGRAMARAPAAGQVDVRVVLDEAEAAAAILERRRRGVEVPAAAWDALFHSEGYRALMVRETAMRRPFTDSSFREFLLADTLLQRAPALVTAVRAYRTLDVSAAAARALAYLPAGTAIRARLYPLIKPRTNSFVFTVDSVPGIFTYIDPAESPAQAANTLAHELHHIGYAAACPVDEEPRGADSLAAPWLANAYLHAFGEGLAMLAAAGSPDVHPHAASDAETRARWDRDTANLAPDIERLERFFDDVLSGRIAADSVRAAAQPFYGVQGPWYTVGWRMAAEVERADGRPALLDAMCEPRRLLRAYNAVAARRGLPRWADALLARFGP